MVSKLPLWAWFGGWALAFTAGMINVVGFLGFEHQAVTHLTGTTSLLATALAGLDVTAAAHFATVIGSFLAGAVASGYIIQHSTLKLGRPYGLVLFLESILLAAAVPFFQQSSVAGIYLTACACGLQNAMVSTFSGAAIRTTHVSGMLTDLGLFLGHGLRGVPVDTLRLRLCALIISAFFGGGILGARIFHSLGYATLWIPAAFTGLSGLAYMAFQAREGT